MGYFLGLVLLRVSYLCSLVTTVTSGVFIRGLSLHLDFCKAALRQCLLLKLLYELKWVITIHPTLGGKKNKSCLI